MYNKYFLKFKLLQYVKTNLIKIINSYYLSSPKKSKGQVKLIYSVY